MGFHLPITTARTVAIRSQFFFSKPLKFTPRRSLWPIMSVLCRVALFPVTVENTEGSRCSGYEAQTTQRIDGGAASLDRQGCCCCCCCCQMPLMASDDVRGGSASAFVCMQGVGGVAWRDRGCNTPPPHTQGVLLLRDVSLCWNQRIQNLENVHKLFFFLFSTA